MGTIDHMRRVFEGIAVSGVMQRKPPQVVLRRWFSWVTGMKAFLPFWNTMLLVICYQGLKSGAFAKDDLPFNVPRATPVEQERPGNDAEAVRLCF